MRLNLILRNCSKYLFWIEVRRRIAIYPLLGLSLWLLLTSCEKSDIKVEDGKLPDQISYNLHIRPILSDNCFACHGPDANKREAGLRLDIEKEAFKTLQDNPQAHTIVPGDIKRSEVYKRIVSNDANDQMPPPESNLALSDHQIRLIEKWIKQGAAFEPHWAFIPPQSPELPKVKSNSWVKNEIDYFILKEQENQGLNPNKEADKETLLRRLSLDLTGLPPSLNLMERFMADNSPEAYESLVDELLASNAYGEKMAVHWMDVARYADSHGYQDDNFRSQWPWRDWVIHAFNKNLPYDQFITWQLAGDLLPEPTKEQILATGFNRNHKITEEGGVIDEEYRVEYVVDRTNTFGKAIIGITMECAQCHDHKYDPISQKDYFQLYAFFNNIREVGHESNIGGPNTYAKHPKIEITDEDLTGILSFINKRDTLGLIVSVMGDLDSIRPTHILERGVYDAPGELVQPAMPTSILEFSNELPKNRLGLVQWLFDTDNPLTSRVFVNRMWKEVFGKGLVETVGDFGMQGDLPTHPELLDWLAVDFRENGWDIKRLMKQIVTSATYMQSAALTTPIYDPSNAYYTRAPRERIKAEFVKDLVMASSGLLFTDVGGPSVKPYQPPGLWEAAASTGAKFGLLGTYIQDSGNDLYRRGLYTFIKRTLPPPSMMIFDASNRDTCEPDRATTNTPLQALLMMNDPMVLEASRVLAARLLKQEGSAQQKLEQAFRLIVNRMPLSAEFEILTAHYQDQLKEYNLNPSEAKKVLDVGEYPQATNLDTVQHAALMQVISLIYNLEETLMKS
ncbi:PSD1 and planctomycete cytochrome C domain-containing protein [Lunatibacter salilacus]|uniref:PSD1 and planctomycete cytochrome C domain-containing protein n=1 Tax=Lunatibacter salilacus TaxID=2483804 RepID=UPI00131A616E|nr:PSD1 and planctomycete cytochrome C domain-containing protein [Lunatibacter salilacus]